MRHLFLSREYPPAPYTAGGIGTYVANVSRLLAEAGETVHVIGQRWPGALRERDVSVGGRLTVHRVPMDSPIQRGARRTTSDEMRILLGTAMPARAWNHNAAAFAESLIEEEGIDVVEAQEWEAPLYPFLLRRAMGLGPVSQPPCVIHLHSPTESVWRHNDWPLSTPYVLQMRRQEEYCIAAADALLCPSAFLADDASRRYRINRDDITTIPYPLGQTRLARRHGSGTKRGPVLYVGRIERRKGLVEFVDAAVSVARDTAEARFVFIGGDVVGPDRHSTLATLEARIPGPMRKRFQFLGEIPRDSLWVQYAGARFAVIPSRWENLPNTCIEAMATGVPVLVSASGGMAEVVVDGESGWLASNASASGLELALRRALRASEDELAVMGNAARDAIQRHCGNAAVVERHMEFRDKVRARGTRRSNQLPAILPWNGAAMSPLGVGEAGPRQTHDVAVTTAEFSARAPDLALPPDGAAAAYAIRLARKEPSGSVALVAPGYVADQEALRAAVQVLRTNGEVGIVTGWVRRGAHETVVAPLCPSFPYQWLGNEAWPIAILRSSAVAVLPELPPDLAEPYASWHLINAMMAAGWKAVSVQWVLGSSTVEPSPSHFETGAERSLEMRRRLRAGFAVEVARDTEALLTMLEPQPASDLPPVAVYGPDIWTGLTLTQALRLGLRGQLALVAEMVHNPRRVWAWIRNRIAPRDNATSEVRT